MKDLNHISSLLKGVRRYGQFSLVAFCPLHDNRRTQALSVTITRNGTPLVNCFAGCNRLDILQYFRSHGVDTSGYKPPVLSNQVDEADQQKRDFAKSLWEKSLPIEGTLAQGYLRGHRQIDYPLPSSLRFHPHLKYSLTGQFFPALVAMVTDLKSNFLGIHRTYLALDGSKADIQSNKMMLGECAGGFVQLSHPLNADALAVGEGLETCLSGAELHPYFKVLSALSTSGMKSIELPKNFEPKNLAIFRDGDKAGFDASNELAKRAYGAGWKVEFLTAPRGQDFNDVLIQKKKGVIS